MRLKLLLVFCISLAAGLRAQGQFHVYAGTEDLIETGRVDILTILSGNLKFKLRLPPKSWSCREDDATAKIVFTDETGRSAITVQFTTNSPGTLPPPDALRAKALQAHPGSSVVISGVCPTNYKPGTYVDLVRVMAGGMVQRMRHAFVADPLGQVEFVLTASDDEFGRGKNTITRMLSTFQVMTPSRQP